LQARKVARSRIRARNRGAAWRYLVAFGYLAFVLLPIFYMVMVSLQDPVSAGTVIVPKSIHWQTFTEMWATVDLGLYLRNSLLIAVFTGVSASILALGAAYVVARFRFRFRNVFRMSLLATHAVPGVLLLLPLFVIYVVIQHALTIHIVGTYYGVVLTYMTFALPFAIWLLSVYVASLPKDIEEQALVDGAHRYDVLRYVTFPLAVPGLVVTFIFSFLLAWNDVLFASVLTSPTTRTIGVGLQNYVAENTLPLWNQLMAASIVSAVPAVILFMIVQRWIVAGLAAGSTKG
jgi:multiple sugar transport system permease protein